MKDLLTPLDFLTRSGTVPNLISMIAMMMMMIIIIIIIIPNKTPRNFQPAELRKINIGPFRH